MVLTEVFELGVAGAEGPYVAFDTKPGVAGVMKPGVPTAGLLPREIFCLDSVHLGLVDLGIVCLSIVHL